MSWISTEGWFRQVLYTAVITCPDVTHISDKLSEFLTNPGLVVHYIIADQALAYLYRIKYYPCFYAPETGQPCFESSMMHDLEAIRKPGGALENSIFFYSEDLLTGVAKSRI